MFSGVEVNTVFSNSGGGTFSGSDSTNKRLIDMYKKLAVYVRTINHLLDEFSKGQFFAVANILTQDMYNKMSIQLRNLANDANKYPDYETLRKNSVNSLHGLYQSILQYAELRDSENQLASSREFTDEVLYDPVRLTEFIRALNAERDIFPQSSVTAIEATIKPEYAEYVRLYGYPAGGIFEMDKLADIFRRLNITF